jgi:subtilisin family serine protease
MLGQLGTAVLDLVNLTPLMERTSGRSDVVIGLLDGPIVADHPDMAGVEIRPITSDQLGTCARTSSAACQHGTFVAGILCARRGSPAPAICPGCSLLVRSIFSEVTPGTGESPSATPEDLGAAITACVAGGARVLNLSVGLVEASTTAQRALSQALDHAAGHGVLVVAAAGNQGQVGSSVITRHPGVIPVVAYDMRGRPLAQSNLGGAIGRRGLGAPGEAITSLGTMGKPLTLGGTSAAAPFVTGVIALLWSAFPEATAAEVRMAVTQGRGPRRSTIVPPLLDAWAAYQATARMRGRE